MPWFSWATLLSLVFFLDHKLLGARALLYIVCTAACTADDLATVKKQIIPPPLFFYEEVKAEPETSPRSFPSENLFAVSHCVGALLWSERMALEKLPGEYRAIAGRQPGTSLREVLQRCFS